MLNPKGIVWVGLFAEDLPALASFYEQTVGLRLLEEADGCVIFDAGAGQLFELWGNGHASKSRKSPSEQSVLMGFLVDRMETVIADFDARGLKADSEIGSHLGTRWVYFTDPEGNRFEIKDING